MRSMELMACVLPAPVLPEIRKCSASFLASRGTPPHSMFKDRSTPLLAARICCAALWPSSTCAPRTTALPLSEPLTPDQVCSGADAHGIAGIQPMKDSGEPAGIFLIHSLTAMRAARPRPQKTSVQKDSTAKP